MNPSVPAILGLWLPATSDPSVQGRASIALNAVESRDAYRAVAHCPCEQFGASSASGPQAGFSRTTKDHLTTEGFFPLPLPLGPSAMGWLLADVDARMASRVAIRDSRADTPGSPQRSARYRLSEDALKWVR